MSENHPSSQTKLLVDSVKFSSVPALKLCSKFKICISVTLSHPVFQLLFFDRSSLDLWFDFKTIVIKLAVAEELC